MQLNELIVNFLYFYMKILIMAYKKVEIAAFQKAVKTSLNAHVELLLKSDSYDVAHGHSQLAQRCLILLEMSIGGRIRSSDMHEFVPSKEKDTDAS